MKKYLSIIPLVLLVSFFSGCQDEGTTAESEEMRVESDDDVEKARLEVEKVFYELQRAVLDSDIETLDRFYADEYVNTTRTGKISTKAGRLAKLKSGELDYLESMISGVDIRVLGSTAVVTGQTEGRVKGQSGENILPPRRFTVVFAKHKGHWLALARHACVIER